MMIGSGVTGNTLAGNFIGLNATGTVPLGNAWTGVGVWGGATSNMVGGATPAACNFISGNLNYGVIVLDAGTTGNVVAGNCIGLKPDGTAAGNAFAGIAMGGGSTGNRIGGGSGEGNRITASGWDGVALYDTTTTGNSILGNQIFDNGGTGIGVWTGTGIAAPTISSASIDTMAHVNGSFTPAGGGSHRVEFFANPSPGDEGRYFIGSVQSSTGAFVANLDLIVPSGHRITATVTSPAGDTSPFSFPVLPTVIDTDSDGIPDAYESAHSLVVGVYDANVDEDGDGASNIAEMFAGSDPQAAGSRLAPLRVVFAANGAEVLLDGPQPGRFYRFEMSDDLATWRTLAFGLFDSPMDSDPGQIRIVDSTAPDRTRRFYRAVIEP
jgi:hypothetical protein